MNLRNKNKPIEPKKFWTLDKKLNKEQISELEKLVPLEIGPIFKRIGYDGTKTRAKLLLLLSPNGPLSLEIVQKELIRRKKIKYDTYNV